MRLFLAIFIIMFTFTACSNNHDEVTTEAAFDTIEIEQIENHVANNYLVVDVREVDEYEAGHIPNAINAPLSALEVGDFGPLESDEKYVIICQSGNRSVMASNILVDQGFDIINVREGMSSWTGDIEK